MPEGATDTGQAQGTDTGQQQGQQQGQQGQQQQTPQAPWEREGQSFDPERAWNLIQTLRGERDGLKTERDQLSQQATQLQKQQMSETERQIAAARDEGRQAAIDELAPELARAQFDALAARRNKDFDTGPALEFVNLKGFVVQGKPDTTKLQEAVNRLVPEATVAAPPSFDGGARNGATPPTDMNSFIRKAVGHTG